jgi:predicted nucleotidyltransferase
MRPDKDNRTRRLLAIEAAKIMAESGMKDFYTAKRKAAARLGMPNTRNLPRNIEIEQALSEHQRLFKQNTQPSQLKELRQTTMRVMRMMESFNPHLVGPVLSGTADQHSDINIHVFTDTSEDVARYLLEESIPFRTTETRLNQAKGRAVRYPAYYFMAGETGIEITVFPVNGIRQAPLSPVDGKPMPRASMTDLDQLISHQATLVESASINSKYTDTK